MNLGVVGQVSHLENSSQEALCDAEGGAGETDSLVFQVINSNHLGTVTCL